LALRNTTRAAAPERLVESWPSSRILASDVGAAEVARRTADNGSMMALIIVSE
jgi:hypothetical protein